MGVYAVAYQITVIIEFCFCIFKKGSFENMKKFVSAVLAVMMLLAVLSTGASAEEKTFKNVIVMIGDGMGENHLEWTKAEYGTDLFVDTLPYQGYSKTNSYTFTTDSAAGGTALSCGDRAINGNIGTLAIPMDDYGAVICTYTNSCEIAKDLGKKTGIVTSDKNSGATPAAFSAHVASRKMTDAICDQQLASDIDLIWGKADSYITEEMANEAGWTYLDGLSDVEALEKGTKSFGQFVNPVEFPFGNEDEAPLSYLTGKAIELLENENGFFLMVEGAHIDKYSHSNDAEGMMKSVLEFDKAIKTAVEFAEEDGSTLVIVTADHETGKITFDEDTQEYGFTQTDHSNTNVPLRVYGSDELVKDGKAIRNRNVSLFTAKKMGCTNYPAPVMNPKFLPEFFPALGKWLAVEIKDLFEGD